MDPRKIQPDGNSCRVFVIMNISKILESFYLESLDFLNVEESEIFARNLKSKLIEREIFAFVERK